MALTQIHNGIKLCEEAIRSKLEIIIQVQDSTIDYKQKVINDRITVIENILKKRAIEMYQSFENTLNESRLPNDISCIISEYSEFSENRFVQFVFPAKDYENSNICLIGFAVSDKLYRSGIVYNKKNPQSDKYIIHIMDMYNGKINI